MFVDGEVDLDVSIIILLDGFVVVISKDIVGIIINFEFIV